MKKKILALVGFASPVAMFAEGTNPTMDTSTADTMVKAATDGLGDLLSTVAPYVTTLFLAGLAIWAAFVIFRLVKRAFSRAA